MFPRPTRIQPQPEAGNTADIANYADLAKAEAAFTKLVTDAAGTITLHVKAPNTWSQVNVHTFGGNNSTVAAEGAPDWPGFLLNPETKNSGWSTISLTTKAATNMLFSDDGNDDVQPEGHRLNGSFYGSYLGLRFGQ